ncbi:unnamed protein product [Blepharisma stoltei]|uniref:DHFR domain-containing protein n=1 Tax=Blepharisma stoltei TaxID=1481888 RepID=A0AAU9K5R0_9CILI|nr:unnamed protein product [Blepharisma stoltei]
MEPRNFILIMAVSENLGIGYQRVLPWKIPEDWEHLLKVIVAGPERNTFVMGRTSWEDSPKPFPNIRNIVVSRSLQSAEGADICTNLREAISISTGLCFIGGGCEIYRECLSPPLVQYCTQIYLTRISNTIKCDTFFPFNAKTLFQDPLVEGFSPTLISKTKSHLDYTYDFTIFSNNNLPRQPHCIEYPPHEEFQYLDLIKEIAFSKNLRVDEDGKEIATLFGKMIKFDLSMSFPLLTTRSLNWGEIVEKLVRGIRGEDEESERSDGLRNDIQFRYFQGQGIHQCTETINLIRNEPSSNKIMLRFGNSCETTCQFYVADGKLSSLVYQSSENIERMPYGIAFYSLFTCLVAQICGLKRGEFNYLIGVVECDLSSIEKLQNQIKRNPYPFPQIKLRENIESIDQFTPEDVELLRYFNHGEI